MKDRKSNKLTLIGSLIVSLFGVAVASVSTYAWYQINNPGQSVNKNNIVQSGSSDLQIDSITGYKTTYDEIAYGQTDYTAGHVTPYNYYTRSGATTDNRININQGGVSDYDIPNEGIGYYIVGNESWCQTHDFDDAYPWKYKSGLRMDDDLYYDNKAMVNSIHLYEGNTFKVRYYYYSGSTPAEIWYNTLDTNSKTTAAAQVDGSGNIAIKSGQSGLYNLYFTDSNKLSFHCLSLDSGASPVRGVPGHHTTRNFSGGWRLYLDLSASTSEWESDSAWFRMNVQWDNGSGSWTQYSFTRFGTLHHYYCDIPSGSIYYWQLQRMQPNTTNVWDTKEPGNLNGNNCIKITGWNGVSTYKYWAEEDGISIIGKINGGDWAQNYAMTRDASGHFLYRYVKLSASNATFKIRIGNSWDKSTPSSDYVISDSSANDIYLIKMDYDYGITCTKVNYQVKVFDSGGTPKATLSTTLQDDGVTFKYANYSLVSSYKFKLYNSISASYHGYDNCTVTVDDSINGYIYGASNSDSGNIKCNYCGSYTINYLPYTNQINVSGSLSALPSNTSSNTYYLDIGYHNDWNTGSPRFAVFVVNDGGTTAVKARWYSMTKTFSSGTIYEITITNVAFTKLKFVRMDGSNNNNYWTNRWNETVFETKPTGTLNYFIVNGKTADEYTGTWNNFYNKPSPDSSGYYLVGTQAFTGSTEVEWSFTAARPMTAGGTTPSGTSTTAYIDGVTLRTGMEFKAWHYNSTIGRDAEYTTLNNDSETTSILKKNGSGNFEVVDGVEGNSFSIYLVNNKIQVVDNEKATMIYFNKTLSQHGVSSFKMGNGDVNISGSNAIVSIYEIGIRVTAEDIASSLQFAIRRRAGGTYTWYTWSTGQADGDYSCTQSASTTFGESTSVASTQTTATGFRISHVGTYQITLIKKSGSFKVKVDATPGEYGEGYYIIPGSNTSVWTNGIKMKLREDNGTNKAVYTCFGAKKDQQIFIRPYLNRTAGDPIKALNNDDTEGGRMTQAAASINGTTGVITFKKDGSYDIYVYDDGGTLKVSFADYSESDFFTMNPIAKTANTPTKVLNCETSMVLEIEFTTTTTGFTANALLDMITPGTGLSQYLSFTYVVDPTLGSYTGFDYMRLNAQYSGLLPANVSGNRSQTSSVSLASGSHKMYILIDYNPTAISSLPTSPTNDFYFVIRLKQEA